MSISKFQAFMSKGCGPVILFFCALVFAGGVFTQCGRNSQMSAKEGGEQNIPPIATVGDMPIHEADVENATNQQLQQFAQGMAVPPIEEAMTTADTLLQIVNRAGLVYIGEKKYGGFSDADLQRAAQNSIEEEIQKSRMNLRFQSGMPKNPTEKDVDDAFKKQYGVTPDEARKKSSDDIKKKLVDKGTRGTLIAGVASDLVMAKAKATVKVDDNELKKSYDQIETKRILFGTSKGDPKTNSAKALAELKSGASFESLIDKYSSDFPEQKKKLSETTKPIPIQAINTIDAYKPLRGLTVGQTTDIMDLPEGKVLYKVVKVSSTLPKDFEKNKAMYREQYAQVLAGKQIQKDLADLAKSDAVKWTSPSYKALFDFALFSRSIRMGSGDSASHAAEAKKVFDEAKTALDTANSSDKKAAIQALYCTEEIMWNDPAADKKALADTRIDTLNKVLDIAESSQVRLDLVDLLIDKKDVADAADQVLKAAVVNRGGDPSGTQTFHDITTKLDKVKAIGTVPADKLKSIQDELDRFRKEQLEADQAKAEEVKRQEDQAKQQAADEKRLKEEQKKAQPPTTTPPSKTPPAPGKGNNQSLSNPFGK